MFLLNLITVARRLVFKILTRFFFIKSPVKKKLNQLDNPIVQSREKSARCS